MLRSLVKVQVLGDGTKNFASKILQLFAGYSHDATWEHVLANHKKDVTDVGVLIVPHHGRKSDRDWEFLNVVNPALTLFGNAPSEHLAYDAWNNRGLPFITNNQSGCIVVNAEVNPAEVYVTCEAYARRINRYTTYDSTYRAYSAGTLRPRKKAAAGSILELLAVSLRGRTPA